MFMYLLMYLSSRIDSSDDLERLYLARSRCSQHVYMYDSFTGCDLNTIIYGAKIIKANPFASMPADLRKFLQCYVAEVTFRDDVFEHLVIRCHRDLISPLVFMCFSRTKTSRYRTNLI